jgi:NTE family protein
MTPLSDDAVATEPFYKVSATWAGARSLSKLALHYSVIGGYLSTNKVPMDQLFYVGGDHVYENSMFPFVGLGYMEIQASNILLGRVAMQYRFYKSHFVTAHLNTVQAQYRFKDVLTTDDWVWGYGLTYGLKTPIGPIKFTAASNNETHDLQTYLSMGYWF